jgi:AcrR family transcriptional regulator
MPTPTRRRAATPSAAPRTPATPPPDAPATPAPAARAPRQERGQRRVEAILDAAAALIVEGGFATATMQAIGARSGTAAGSLYHFFPDRDSVLRALAERHVRALTEVAAGTHAFIVAGGAHLTVRERVERFLSPLLRYIERQPDFLLVMQWAGAPAAGIPRDRTLDTIAIAMAEQVVGTCDRMATAAERAVRSAMVIAAIEGTLAIAARTAVSRRGALLHELERMLVAYLDTGSGEPPAAPATPAAPAAPERAPVRRTRR